MSLIKPGIVRGNLITGFAGAMLASKGNIDIGLIVAMLIGLAGVIASGCVFNNYIDRDIDSKMSRTKNRALVTGEISNWAALSFGVVLLVCGLLTLLFYTNALTTVIALFGFFSYVVVYGYFKRNSIYGTEVGSISGATPPVIGYLSVSGSFDLASLILFIILVVWQMPHFFAIGIFRAKEYKSAGLPIRSVLKGIDSSARMILVYIALFLVTAPLLTVFDYTGWAYLAVMISISLYWLSYGLKSSRRTDSIKWSKGMFGISLLVLLVFSTMISLDAWLP